MFGVNASGQYYVNWGWSGDSNGYCTLHNFTTATGATGQAGSYVFNYGEAMIIGIEPPAGALTDPRIRTSISTIDMSTIVDNPVTATFTVNGYNLTEGVNLTLTGDNVFSLGITTLSIEQVENGVDVTVTYNPTTPGNHEATVTLTSEGAENVTVKLNGIAELETYAPEMLEATNITSTSFKAVWTDETPAENVESYTLYVSAEPFLPAVALLDSIDWSPGIAYVPEGWTAQGLNDYSYNNACYLSNSGYVQSRTYDLTGYDKVTVMVYAERYNTGNTITVSTSVDTKTLSLTSSSFTWYTFVLNCASSDYVKMTASGLPDLRYMKVYAGDLTEAQQLRATETGDEFSRIITGITDKNYTVRNLAENGHYYFYVVANYIDGGTGDSNTQEVTLFGSAPAFERGNVDGIGGVDMDDLAALINYLLDDNSPINELGAASCSDINDTVVDMDDLAALINFLLTNQWPD